MPTPAAPAMSTNLCGCGCEKSLEPSFDGKYPVISGEQVNSSCYDQLLKALVLFGPITEEWDL